MKKTLTLILLATLVSGCGKPAPATSTQSSELANTAAASQTDRALPVATPAVTPPPNATSKPTEEKKLIDAKVTKVVDGDTLDVLINDKNETVRMILVDTPETKKPNTPVQPFGPEASAFTKETLEGKDIKLERDVSERDQYNRLLFYVYIGDKMFNEILLEKGLARVAVFPPDVKYVDRLREIQKKAQEAKVGIWSIENYATDNGFDDSKVIKETPTVKPKATPAPAAKEPAPANVYYKNCTEVKHAGKAPLHRGDPGYRSALDRDNDGIACE